MPSNFLVRLALQQNSTPTAPAAVGTLPVEWSQEVLLEVAGGLPGLGWGQYAQATLLGVGGSWSTSAPASTSNSRYRATSLTALFREEVLEGRAREWLGSNQLARPASLTAIALLVLLSALATGLFLWAGHYTRKAHVSGLLVPDRGLIGSVAC